MNNIVHVDFWRWFASYTQKDSRFAPTEEGLTLLKAGWENGKVHRVPDMYSYMEKFMQQYDNPRAKL